MRRQTWISLIVCAVILLAGSAGSYLIHRDFALNVGGGSLLAEAPSAASAGSASAAGQNAGTENKSQTDETAADKTEKDSSDGVDSGAQSGADNGGEAAGGESQKGGEEDGKTLKEIISSVGQKVVMIETPDGSIGSGFLYNDRGDIMTNAHVVAGFEDVEITTSDAKKMAGRVIGIGEETDVAVVRVEDLEGVEPLALKLEAEAEVGDEVLALGSPLGLQNTVTTGIISGVDRTFDIDPYYYEGLYQISAPIAPGNSGGPLIDRATGQVLGINSAVTDEGGIGFSIPVVSIVDSAEGWSESPMKELPVPDYLYDEYGMPYDDSQDGSGDDYGDEYGDDLGEATELEYAAEDVLYDFYNFVGAGDYKSAYELLGGDWKAKLSYEKFASGYKDTLGVYMDYCVGVENGDGTVSVYVSITADERKESGAAEAAAYDLIYQVGYEDNDLKMFSGKSE
ncbi:S1C family serine protease [Saccharibacillus sp. CPCC 101409]|uniref:S1C family serine protease n=1 Tax=Saccharibacillus sp. CPCC 101409 TaxID=3058041 RepID=UPI00267375F1|nr:S1C family serine protease [Saccharibacillus sp. CPCC 101409]MDO3412720.1 S1C family serine protease [Saccharibacillus sp. CPCC 101409]